MGSGPHNGEFSIVRHEILDDSKFEAVYDNDNLLATWLRLLIEADKTWPAPAAIPFGTGEDALHLLVEAGLIQVLPHHQFIFVGMAKERERRKARFKAAADARWNKSNAHTT